MKNLNIHQVCHETQCKTAYHMLTPPQWATVNNNLVGENLDLHLHLHPSVFKSYNPNKLNVKPEGKLYDSYGAKAYDFKMRPLKTVDSHLQENIKVYFETPKFTKSLANRYNKITSDQYRRGRYLGSELERKVLKGLLSSKTKQIKTKRQLKSKNKRQLNPLWHKSFGFSQLVYNPAVNRKLGVKMSTLTRIRNRCVLTSHRSSIGKLGVSRIVFRTLAGFGQLPGIKKI